MLMPLPKMTKAHRMYLYGVLTTAAVAVLVAGLTIAVMSYRVPGNDPENVVRYGARAPKISLPPEPGSDVGNTIKPPKGQLSGWVKYAYETAIVIETTDGNLTVHIPTGTPVSLLNAAAPDPTKSETITTDRIPVNALAHITLVSGSDDTAQSVVVVKSHD